jgi:hypothetical protein
VVYLQGTSTSSAFVTQPGDLYMTGGWPTIVLGELVVGLMLGGIWQLTTARGSGRRICLYAILSPMFANAGQDFQTLGRVSLQTVVVYGTLLCVLLVRKNEKSTSPEDSAHSRVPITDV